VLVLGVLLALSLVTVLAVVVSCELQARQLQRTAGLHPANSPADPFDEIVAGLLADDPTFGRRAA
jgi:hypothetical protein